MEPNILIAECQKQQLPIKCMVRNADDDSNVFVFVKDKKYADIECYDSGVILAVTSDKDDDDDRPDVWTVDDIDETLTRIKEFFNDKT